MNNNHAAAHDMGKGFGAFVDRVLRGRNNKWILNGSIGMSALEMGIPNSFESIKDLDFPSMVVNNWNMYGVNTLRDHPVFHFAAPAEENTNGFTLFGADFHDMHAQLFNGEASRHHSPYYSEQTGGASLAEKMGLPDLPYGDLAHFAHLAFAVYDIGRTFQDVWRNIGDYYEKNNTSPTKQGIGLAAHLGKTITSPEMLHTFAARATMLTAMGLLHHTLGPIVALGVGYLAAHLVHSFFGVLEHNKETIQKMDKVPLLRGIYNHTGIKEWAEKDIVAPNEASESEVVDPYQELELTPEREVHHAHGRGRVAHMQPSLDPT